MERCRAKKGGLEGGGKGCNAKHAAVGWWSNNRLRMKGGWEGRSGREGGNGREGREGGSGREGRREGWKGGRGEGRGDEARETGKTGRMWRRGWHGGMRAKGGAGEGGREG